MKALVLTSNSLRHRYFAASIAKCFEVPAVLSQAKQNYYEAQQEQSAEIRAHFGKIRDAENVWFVSRHELPANTEAKLVADINAPDCVSWATSFQPDVICLFGTAILNSTWLDAFPRRIVNLHLGLSPYYRGSATLFWPFVNRELDCLGTTIHLATARVDAGEILARVMPEFHQHEDYYAITSRLIRDSIDRFPVVVADYLSGRLSPVPQENIHGRLYKKADFSESNLLSALGYVGEGLQAAEIKRIQEAVACRFSQ